MPRYARRSKRNTRPRYRKTTRRSRPTRRYTKIRPTRTSTLYFTPKGQVGFPRRAFVKLKYADNSFDFTTNVGNGYRALQIFRGSSVYDPDYSGVGAQPNGYDQIAAVYQNYRVRGAKISIYFRTATVATTAYQIRAFLFTTLGAVDYSGNTTNALATLKGVRQISFNQQTAYNKKPHLTMYCSSKKALIGIDIKDQENQAAVTASPSTNWMFNIIVDTNTGSNTSGVVGAAVFADITITYYVELWNNSILEDA